MPADKINAASSGTWTLGDRGTGPVRYATELIREALSPYPDDLVIVTKVGPGDASTVLAIPGTGNPAHLAENVAAGALRLSTVAPTRRGRPGIDPASHVSGS